MKRENSVLVIACALVCASCRREVPAPPLHDAGAPAPVASTPPRRSPLPDAAPSGRSFDVVALAHGAALVRADSEARRLYLTRLDDRGRSAGAALLLHDALEARLDDVVAVAVADRVAVAWNESNRVGTRVRARVHDFEAKRGGRVLELGAFDGRTRGGLAGARRGDDFVFLAPLGVTPCSSSRERDCVEFGMRRIRDEKAEPWGLPLAVPSPCALGAVGLAFGAERHHYAVCSERLGKPVTTVFSIQPEPQYARAEPVLDGCRADAASELDGDLVLAGDCFGRRTALRFGAAHLAPRALAVSAVAARCAGRQLALRDPAPDGVHVVLEAPRSRVEAFLPRGLAPEASRAAWTGRALVVAVAASSRVEVQRYACVNGELQRMTP